MSQPTLPPTASVAEPMGDGRLTAPAAERNSAAITALLSHHAPAKGAALEIASGTGQHVVGFARALPGLVWQPSDIDAGRRASIDAWATRAGLPNLRPAIALDACAPGWGAQQAGQALIVLVNLLHLITTPQAQTLITQAATALDAAGRLIVYGPFLRNGETTSPGDVRFHASLVAQNPAIGYKDGFDVIDWLHAAGLQLVDVVEMPANNMALVAEKPG